VVELEAGEGASEVVGCGESEDGEGEEPGSAAASLS
jgi:hypothetical protein